MMKTLALGIAMIAAWAAPAPADDVYKWTDEKGQVHFSNRPHSGSGAEPADEPPSSGVGWESVLERQKGNEEIAAQADTALNSLSLLKIRRVRDRDRQAADLEGLRRDIVRAQQVNAPELASLRAREATEVTELGRIEAELNQLEMQIARLRALKQAGKEQTGRSTIEQ